MRVTRHRIYALLQRVPFTKKQLARLPQLSAALAEVCEAPHVFVLRRLRTVLNKIRENGLELTRELRADARVKLAHADLSGFSLFEEAQYRGVVAAERVLAAQR